MDWKFHHFGPYASALAPYIGDPTATATDGLLAELMSKERAPLSQDHDLQSAAVEVVHQWANSDLNALLDYVYFETEPMQAASRGDMLDFRTVNRDKACSLSIKLDSKKIKELRQHVQLRAAAYGKMRHPSTAPEDLFSNLSEWDSDRSIDLQPGSCSIDPLNLKQ